MNYTQLNDSKESYVNLDNVIVVRQDSVAISITYKNWKTLEFSYHNKEENILIKDAAKIKLLLKGKK